MSLPVEAEAAPAASQGTPARRVLVICDHVGATQGECVMRSRADRAVAPARSAQP